MSIIRKLLIRGMARRNKKARMPIRLYKICTNFLASYATNVEKQYSIASEELAKDILADIAFLVDARTTLGQLETVVQEVRDSQGAKKKGAQCWLGPGSFSHAGTTCLGSRDEPPLRLKIIPGSFEVLL
jgi:hypothetical protein